MTPEQIALARHALGLTVQKRSYRNHYVVGEGGEDYAEWMKMAEAGHAVRHNPRPIFGGDYCFTLTQAGAQLALKRGEKLDPKDFPSNENPKA